MQKSNRLCDQSISTSHFWIAPTTVAIRLFTPASDLHPWSCITNPREREILQGHVNCKVQKSNRLCDQSISTSNFQIAPITIAIRVFTPAQICIHSPACITNQRERERDRVCVSSRDCVTPACHKKIVACEEGRNFGCNLPGRFALFHR